MRKVILADSSGFCFGVKRAVDEAIKVQQQYNKKIYTLGPLIHNNDVVNYLEKNNIFAIGIEDINKLKKNPKELEVLGDGTQTKPYLYVKDLVEAIVLVWKSTSEQINYFNLGVESRSTVKEMAEMVIEEMGLDATIRYTGGNRGWVGDVPQFSYSLDKIHKLGWSAKVSSNEAVRKSIQYILEKDLCKQS